MNSFNTKGNVLVIQLRDIVFLKNIKIRWMNAL